MVFVAVVATIAMHTAHTEALVVLLDEAWQNSPLPIQPSDEDVAAMQKALVSVQRALWGLVITGMTVAATLLSGVHIH